MTPTVKEDYTFIIMWYKIQIKNPRGHIPSWAFLFSCRLGYGSS